MENTRLRKTFTSSVRSLGSLGPLPQAVGSVLAHTGLDEPARGAHALVARQPQVRVVTVSPVGHDRSCALPPKLALWPLTRGQGPYQHA